jgi:hypothetical protein
MASRLPPGLCGDAAHCEMQPVTTVRGQEMHEEYTSSRLALQMEKAAELRVCRGRLFNKSGALGLLPAALAGS